jgi:hypothetical protein
MGFYRIFEYHRDGELVYANSVSSDTPRPRSLSVRNAKKVLGEKRFATLSSPVMKEGDYLYCDALNHCRSVRHPDYSPDPEWNRRIRDYYHRRRNTPSADYEIYAAEYSEIPVHVGVTKNLSQFRYEINRRLRIGQAPRLLQETYDILQEYPEYRVIEKISGTRADARRRAAQLWASSG